MTDRPEIRPETRPDNLSDACARRQNFRDANGDWWTVADFYNHAVTCPTCRAYAYCAMCGSYSHPSHLCFFKSLLTIEGHFGDVSGADAIKDIDLNDSDSGDESDASR